MKENKFEQSGELVRRARQGDQAAFTALYEGSSPILYRSIRSMVRDEELAWDILQNSYLRAFQSLDTLKNDDAFLPWLRRIAVNVTAREMARKQPLTFTDLEEADGDPYVIPETRPDFQPELQMDRQETSRLIREILAKLSPEQRLVMGMFYYEEMRIPEISDTLHVTQGTVKTNLHRGRRKVESELLALEQHGLKLYGLSPMGFLLALLGQQEAEPAAREKALQSLLSKTAKLGAQSVPLIAEPVGSRFLFTAAGKLVGGLLGLALTGGLIFGAAELLNAKKHAALGDYRPSDPSSTLVMANPDERMNSDVSNHVSTTADGEPDALLSGSCGDHLRWHFDSDTGTLTIEGSGDIPNYWKEPNLEQDPPWSAFTTQIQSISLPEGLTGIGSNAFSYCTALSNISIPRSVTHIGEAAFANCIALTDLSISDGVIGIGDSAFSECSALTSLSIPDGVIGIGDSAFSECSALTSVSISDSVADIGVKTFYHCSALTAIEVASDNPSYSSLDGVLFNKSRTELIQYPAGKTKPAYTVPDGVAKISNHAFSDCSAITSISLPASVTDIGYLDLGDCIALASIEVASDNPSYSSLDGVLFNKSGTELIQYTIRNAETNYTVPDGVSSISDDAFCNCMFLKSVTIPDGVTVIGSGAFYNCSALTSVSMPDSLTDIGDSAFSECRFLKELSIPEAVTGIGDSAFSKCRSLTALSIPDGVTVIGDSVFSECKSLTAMSIPDGVTVIGSGAFYGCSALTSVSMPDSLTDIGGGAFSECSSLTAMSIPDGVSNIGDGVFYDCSALTDLRLPQGVTSIGSAAFERCSALTSISIPDSVSSIGGNAFLGCRSLTEISIPKGVTVIKEYTFAGCGSLANITIPDSVVRIESHAFAYCNALTSISIPDSVIFIGGYVFYNCNSLAIVSVPASVTTIDTMAFGWCQNSQTNDNERIANFTIRGATGSAAQRYAEENQFPFLPLD